MHSGAVSNTSNSMKRTAAAALYNETGTHSQGNKYNSSDGHSSSDTKNQSLSPSPPEKRSFIVVESPLKLDTIDSAEDLDLKVLQIQNKNLSERVIQRKRLEDELREKIDMLENRKLRDDNRLCTMDRYWTQLDEDLRLILERFDSDNCDKKATNPSVRNFLLKLNDMDKVEMEETLKDRIKFTTQTVAKLITNYDKTTKRQEQYFKELAQSSSDNSKIKIQEICNENNRLNDIITKCQQKNHTMGLEKKQFEDQISKLETDIKQLQAKNDSTEYDLDKFQDKAFKLDRQLADTIVKLNNLQKKQMDFTNLNTNNCQGQSSEKSLQNSFTNNNNSSTNRSDNKTDKQVSEKVEIITKVLSKIQNHLKTLENVYKHFDADPTLDSSHARKLDMNLANYCLDDDHENNNKSSFKTVQETFISMLYDGLKIHFLNSVLATLDISELNINSLTKNALSNLCDLLKDEDKHKISKENRNKSLDKLKILLNSISTYITETETKENGQKKQKNGSIKKKNQGEQPEKIVVSTEDVMECMRNFCNDQEVDISLRLLVLEELKKEFKSMDDEDLMLLLVYKTNAILTNCNQFNNQVDLVDSNNIRSEEERLSLITKLIDISSSQNEFTCLVNLLKVWPTFQNIESDDQKPWNKILTNLVDKNLSFVWSVQELRKAQILVDSDMEMIRSQLETMDGWNNENGQHKIQYLKMCLSYQNEKILKNYLRFVDLKCFTNENDLDNLGENEHSASMELILNDTELMELILKDQTYVSLIHAPLFLIFIHFALNNLAKNVIYDIVRCLKKQEFLPEAAKLFADAENFHGDYQTISNCLAMVGKFE